MKWRRPVATTWTLCLAALIGLLWSNGVPAEANEPPTLTGVIDIASGYGHTCAVVAPGEVKCWGDNWIGQLGDGTTSPRPIPTDVSGLTNAVAVAAGFYHTCALTTVGGLKCWGNNQNGQVGDGAFGKSHVAVDVVGLGSGVANVEAGGAHTCALTTAGAVKCWGGNHAGQLGIDSSNEGVYNTPLDVTGLGSDVAAVTSGGAHTCALTTAGAVKC